LASAADVKKAHQAFVPGLEGAHGKEQWCYAAVSVADAKTTCTFKSMSKGEYHAMLYCETIEGWFFASSKFVNVTAKDNGGKPVGLTLTYSKEIDAVKDNAVVLNICKGLAEAMAVPYSRVTDAYGGYHGKPSGNLPAAAAAAKPAAAANKTATATTKTRVLQATTATTPATTSTATTATTTAANATAAK